MELSKEQRKERIAELRKYHEKTFEALGIPNAYYCCKLAHYAKDGDTEKVIGLYPSEVEKGDDVYVEFCTFDYTPVDTNRRLYVWKHRPQGSYEMKKSQYLIPVSELSPVHELLVDNVDVKLSSEAFVVIETTQIINKTVKYKGPREGVEFEIEYKNDVPSLLYYKDSKLPVGYQGFRMADSMLTDMIEFIKQLK